MKIYTAGIETETNTFSPVPTEMDDFDITRREDLSKDMSELAEILPYAQWQKKALDRNDHLIFGLSAWATPAGLTCKAAYEQLRDELLVSLENCCPVDIVLLSLHGAMVAQGYDDCEGDILRRTRELVGPDVIVAAELDLHCHLTDVMIDNADILITFKEYPHNDIAARGDEIFDLAIKARLGECSPTIGMFDCKMIGMYPTTTPIMRSFIDGMKAVEREKKVLSVSFGHGYPFGDVPDAGGKILVVTDDDAQLAQRLSEQLGREIFSLRHSINFNALPLEEAFSKAVSLFSSTSEAEAKPIVVADQSDNAGGGAPSDATFALQWLLDHQIKNVAVAIMCDPEVVKQSILAGIGAELSVSLGGKMGVTSGDPLELRVTVTDIKYNYVHQFPQSVGVPTLIPVGDTVALLCEGIDIVVSSLRSQCFCPSIFDDLGISFRNKKLLVIKSAQHFYGAFAPVSRDVIYMAGPGAVPPIMQLIPYQRISVEDKFPWVDNPFEIVSTD